MAATIVKTLLVSVCLLNLNLFCAQAIPMQQNKDEVDYTIEIRDAKITTISSDYFSKITTLYMTMYNDSFAVIDGIIDLVKLPPADAQVQAIIFKYDTTNNRWMKRPSQPSSTPCDFIKKNKLVMKKVYQYSNFTTTECPINLGVYAINNLRLDTEAGFPKHVPEAPYRINILMTVKDVKEPLISLDIYGDVVSKSDSEDD